MTNARIALIDEMPTTVRRGRIGPSWAAYAIGLFFLLAIATPLLGGARALERCYTPAAVLLGIALWRYAAAEFISFAFLLFFLNSLIRRLVDFQLGWDPTNPVIPAPWLVAGVSALSLVRPGRRPSSFALPTGCALVAIAYAFAIGIGRNGWKPAAYDLLEWGVPPLTGLYLLTEPFDAPRVRRALLRTFALGAAIMGVYGVIQFVRPPPWDVLWVRSCGLRTIGVAEPYRLRVFSTMNAPWSFAMGMMALVLILLADAGRWRWAAFAGFAGLLLSAVRSAWVGLIAGAVVLIAGSEFRARRRMAQMMLGLVAVAVAATMIDGIGRRVRTLLSPGADASLSVRMRFVDLFAGEALANPIGAGLGGTGVATKLGGSEGLRNFDSGILNLPYVLGWPAALVYGFGALTIFIAVLRRGERSRQALPGGAAAVTALLSQMLFVNSLTGVAGFLFWCVAGFHLREDSIPTSKSNGHARSSSAQ